MKVAWVGLDAMRFAAVSHNDCASLVLGRQREDLRRGEGDCHGQTNGMIAHQSAHVVGPVGRVHVLAKEVARPVDVHLVEATLLEPRAAGKRE